MIVSLAGYVICTSLVTRNQLTQHNNTVIMYHMTNRVRGTHQVLLLQGEIESGDVMRLSTKSSSDQFSEVKGGISCSCPQCT